MSSTYRGSLLPFLQSESWDFTPNQGYVHHLEFKGLSIGQMQGLQADYVKAGIACRLTNALGIAYFDVQDSTQQYTIDTWQIAGNELHEDILNHPTILSMGLSLVDQRILREAFNNATEDWADIYDEMDDTANSAMLQIFYGLYLRGSTEYQKGQYVLRHTTNAPNRGGDNVSDDSVDFIYTTAQLLTEVRSSIWSFPLPDRLYTKIINITPPQGVIVNGGNQTDFTNYLWGWLKQASTETTAANNRIDISTEYVLENWSTKLYRPL